MKKKKTHPKTIGHHLKIARKQQKFTIEQLARKVGLLPRYVKAIEDGTITDVPADVLSSLARALGKTVAELRGAPAQTAHKGYL